MIELGGWFSTGDDLEDMTKVCLCHCLSLPFEIHSSTLIHPICFIGSNQLQIFPCTLNLPHMCVGCCRRLRESLPLLERAVRGCCLRAWGTPRSGAASQVSQLLALRFTSLSPSMTCGRNDASIKSPQ